VKKRLIILSIVLAVIAVLVLIRLPVFSDIRDEPDVIADGNNTTESQGDISLSATEQPENSNIQDGQIEQNTDNNIGQTSTEPADGLTAAEWVSNVTVGWNLGNTFDAHENRRSPEMSVGDMETRWVRHLTTAQNFATLKEAGFNAVRIPVTWYKATDEDNNIREDWMRRIKQVVNYALESNMQVILNTHHEEEIFKLLDEQMDESKAALVKIWEQISDAFKDFDERLAFEGLGEPRTIGSAAQWSGGTEEERDNLNILNQIFVDTVRKSGGNNSNRVLIVPTYAASGAEVAQRGLVIPNDTVDNRLAVSLHVYTPWEFALRTSDEGTWTQWSIDNPRDTQPITEPMDLAYELFVSNGIPVVMGEMGAINRDNTAARVAWARFYVTYARSKGIACFWWDNYRSGVVEQLEWGWTQPFGLLDRANNVFFHPEIVAALMDTDIQ